MALVFAQTDVPSPPACQILFQTGIDPTGAPVLANSVTIGPGGAVTLVWRSRNASGGTITGVGPVGASGSINLLPPIPISSGVLNAPPPEDIFTGTFTGPGGTGTCQAVVMVSSPSLSAGNPAAQTTAGAPASAAPTTPTPTPTTATPPSANGGLVPCGLGGFVSGINGNGTSGTDQNAATGCQACNLAQLISLVIKFLIGLSIPIAALLFAYAGVLYFTSGANPGNKEKAKAVFKNVFIGFLFAITGWLVVNTLLHALLDGGHIFTGGNWFTIQCAAPNSRPVNTKINDVLSSLPTLNTLAPPSLNNISYVCPSGWTLSGGTCINPDNPSQTVAASSNDYVNGAFSGLGPTVQCSNSGCSPSAYQAADFSPAEAQAMACIAMTENSGMSTGCTGNACGALQIMLTANPLSGPSCAKYSPTGSDTLNCPAMCKGANGVAVQTAACQPCVQAANDAACNAESAQALYAQSGYSPWLPASSGGSSDNQKSLSCVQKYDPGSDSL